MTQQNKNCENLGGGNTLTCEQMFDCCSCGTDDQENGCGCRYCWDCNACQTCLNEEE